MTIKLTKKVHNLFKELTYLTCIKNDKEYNIAIKYMEELIEDYEYNKYLIIILSDTIQNWENKTFTEFNKKINDLDHGVSLLKVLMQQHNLGIADFPEIGSKSLISKIINGHRNLTVKHIKALSAKFNINADLFL